MTSGDIAIKIVIYIAAGVATVLFTVLGWLGKRVLENKEQAADRRDDQLETLAEQVRENAEQLRRIKTQMGKDHEGVEDAVSRLDDKLDKTHALIQDLR
jgi:uncharacterized protein HemX